MGVKNLWRLLLPVGKRISIETLSHQTLAIDASIWLTQISKACRDPETGRLLPNRPHIRIFLLRLMRLLYHRIKPVVVFDGIMPEVKRRELQRRRDRREKLWRGTAGENGADADAALKRTAKKILVKQLKEWREKKLDAAGGKNNPKVSPAKRSSLKKSAATAFAAGFTTGEEESDGQVQNAQPDNVEQLDRNTAATEKKDKSNDEDTISIKSSGSDDEVQQSEPEAMNDDNNIVNDNAYESENDWEMAAAIQSSIDDSMKERQQQQQMQHQDLSQQPVEAIASLPSEARSQWMESQYKAQRIQSRRECIGAAANPENYSSTQLRNFLKGSKLNKKMGEIGKLAGKLGETDTDDNGFVTVDENRGSANGHRRVLKRPNHNNNDDDSDDDLLNNNEQSTMKALFGDDSDESDKDVGVEEEGGGFLLPNKDAEMKHANQKSSTTTTNKDEIVIDDSSADGDSVEQATNGAAALSDHNISHTDSNERVFNEGGSSTPSESARKRLMAFTSADEEWATWGEVDTQNNQSTGQPTKSIATKSATSDILESDSDGDDDPTFLPLHQKLKVGSSFTNTMAKSITSSYNPTPKTQDALEDEEDDDIEWEDGSDIDEDNNGERKEETVPLNESNQQSLQEESEEVDDENIDWQEGGDDESVSNEKLMADQSSKLTPMNDDDNDDVVILSEGTHETYDPKFVGGVRENAIEIDETGNDTTVKFSTNIEKEVIDLDTAQSEVYSSDSSSNSFDMSDMNHDDPTTAALRHAQETASKLTDWAGRAVQRAIAAHIEENGGPSPEQRLSEKKNEMVDLTADDENDSKLNLEDTINQNTEHANTATNTATETMNLFDTSLEGLNKVHDDIIEEEKLMERDMSTITDEMKMDILSLLQLCGIPWVESPSEAEAQCAELEKLGLVDGIVTEDSDVFVFGGRKVYKNFFNEQKYVEAYFSKDIQKDLALGRSQLVALAMLLGGDYTDGVKGVGIVNGMEILQSFAIEDGKDGIRNGLQRFREWLDGIGDPLFDDKESTSFLSKEGIFHKKHQSARTRWIAPADFPSPAIIDGYMKPAVDNSAVNFTWGTPDIEGLRQFCANSIGWDSEETDRVVKPVLKILESSSTQTRIESYFMKYDDNITFAKVKSKRLKAVLDDIQTGADKEEPNKKQCRLDDGCRSRSSV